MSVSFPSRSTVFFAAVGTSNESKCATRAAFSAAVAHVAKHAISPRGNAQKRRLTRGRGLRVPPGRHYSFPFVRLQKAQARVVPAEQAREVAAAARATRVPRTFVEAREDGHLEGVGLRGRQARVLVASAGARFRRHDGPAAVEHLERLAHGPRAVDVRDHLVVVAVVAITSDRDASKQRERVERPHYRCLAPAIRIIISCWHAALRSSIHRVAALREINKVILLPCCWRAEIIAVPDSILTAHKRAS